MNIDSLLTLVEDGLLCRQYDWELVNKNFGTDISVDFGKLWKNVEIKQQAEQTEETSDEETATAVEETSEEEVEEDEQEETT